jgi:hypothetical protein
MAADKPASGGGARIFVILAIILMVCVLGLCGVWGWFVGYPAFRGPTSTPGAVLPGGSLDGTALATGEGGAPSATQGAAPTAPPVISTSPTLGQSRAEPVPLGQPFPADEVTLQVLQFTRPANDQVFAASEFNAPPADGNEYVMVNLSATCNRSAEETCLVGPADMKVVGSIGIVRPAEFLTGIANELQPGEFFGGVTKSGAITFQVAISETDLIMIYEKNLSFGGPAYFRLQP